MKALTLLVVASAFLIFFINSQPIINRSFIPTDVTWNSLIPGSIKQVDLSELKDRLLMFVRDKKGEFCVPYTSYPGRRENREPLSFHSWICDQVSVVIYHD